MKTTKDLIYKSLLANSVAQAIADASNDGIVLIDAEHKVAFINETFQVWLNWNGLHSKDLVGKKDSFLYKKLLSITELPSRKLLKALFSTVEGKQNLISERIDIKFIQEIYAFLTVFTAPIYHEKKGYLGRLWLFDNRTREKRMDRMKTEFISIASHQLRTPLSAITGYLSMLLSGDAGKLSPEIREFVQSAYDGANRLTEIVEDLLDVSRFEMGKTMIDKKKHSLSKFFKNLLKTYRQRFQDKQIHVSVDFKIKKDKIYFDEKLLFHTVGNLIDNSIKYTPKNGNIYISVKTYTKKTAHWIRIEIQDTGVGIPKNQQDYVFQKFFRADNVRTENFKGTGIGLYFVSKIVNSLRGNVWFKSTEKKGTTFFVEIPEK